MASAIVRSHRMPFVANDLIRKLKKINMKGEKEVIKTWSRGSTITPQMIGVKISIHNGKNFKRLNVTDRMVGHKLGEFALTRKRRPHAKFIADANKKKVKGKGRSFSTCAQIWCFDDKDETRSIGINSCIETTPILFSGGFDLLTPAKGLCEVVNLRDESAFIMKAGRSSGNSDNAVFWGVNMPAIGKENEKVLMDRNNLISKQEDEEGSMDEGSEWRFSSWINFSQKVYTIKTEMKKIFALVHV